MFDRFQASATGFWAFTQTPILRRTTTKSSRSPTSLGWRFYKMMMLMILLRTMTKSSRSRTSLGSSFYQQFASPQILPYQMTLFQPHLDLDYMWSRSLLLAGRSVWSLSRSSLFFPCLLLCRWKGERRVTGQVEIIQRGRRRCHQHHRPYHTIIIIIIIIIIISFDIFIKIYGQGWSKRLQPSIWRQHVRHHQSEYAWKCAWFCAW